MARKICPPFVGQVEIWAKWTSLSLELDEGSGIEIGKVRRLRKFDTSGIVSREVPLDSSEEPLEGDEKLLSGGCIVELTKLRLPNAGVWWTLGLEAFGTIWTVRKNLKLSRSSSRTMAARDRTRGDRQLSGLAQQIRSITSRGPSVLDSPVLAIRRFSVSW